MRSYKNSRNLRRLIVLLKISNENIQNNNSGTFRHLGGIITDYMMGNILLLVLERILSSGHLKRFLLDQWTKEISDVNSQVIIKTRHIILQLCPTLKWRLKRRCLIVNRDFLYSLKMNLQQVKPLWFKLRIYLICAGVNGFNSGITFIYTKFFSRFLIVLLRLSSLLFA